VPRAVAVGRVVDPGWRADRGDDGYGRLDRDRHDANILARHDASNHD
jgi:hypothetical protein